MFFLRSWMDHTNYFFLGGSGFIFFLRFESVTFGNHVEFDRFFFVVLVLDLRRFFFWFVFTKKVGNINIKRDRERKKNRLVGVIKNKFSI